MKPLLFTVARCLVLFLAARWHRRCPVEQKV